MFRAANQASRNVLSRVGSRPSRSPGQLMARPQTTGPPPARQKGGVSAGVVGFGAATLSLGGTVAYAWYDPNFRDTLESTVPYADLALGYVLGEKKPTPPPLPPLPDVPSKLKLKKKPAAATEDAEKTALPASDPQTAVGAPNKSEDTEKPTKVSSEASAGKDQDPPAAADTAGSGSDPPARSSQSADEAAAERAGRVEADHAVENSALEQILQELSQQAQMALEVAVDAQQHAANAVIGHMERVYRSLDDATEADWSAVQQSADLKAQLCNKAEELSKSAKEYLDKLAHLVEEARENRITKDNDKLLPVQEALSQAYYKLDSAKNKVAAALSEARVLDEFRRLVDESRSKFQQEMSSIVPGVVLGEKNDKLTEEELNVLLVHAYRKVLYLQKELARMLTVEQQKFSSALERQRAELSASLEERMATELARQQREQELEYRRRLDNLQQELEHELRQQLRRQAAAHSDHLQDVLSVQERELKRKFDSIHEDKVRVERYKMQAELATMMGELKGLKEAIKARADLDRAAHHAQQMWVACQGLKQSIRTGRPGASSWQQQLKPLQPETDTIRQLAGPSDVFVEVVLSSLPAVALERGVFTEDALKERFIKVERVCKRVNMIDDNGGSLLKYALSYLQSFLVVDAFERLPGKELRDEPISTDLSTYDIIARARYCMDKDDLLQAVRYMGLLRGEPRQVASDWLREARLLLEARQAADALLAHAAATGLQAV